MNIEKFSTDLNDILSSWKEKHIFNFEITTTNKCNCNCLYCFENDKERTDKTYKVSDIIKNIHYLLSHPLFSDHFKVINLSFWGGEPTLKIDDILTYIEEFGKNQSIAWHFYTNGTLKDNIKKIIKELKKRDALSRLKLQISWDGDPIHDINRISKTGISKSSLIKETFKELYYEGINLDLKGTISPKDFKYIPEIWKSYESFINDVTEGNEHHLVWAPTIDQTFDSENDYYDDFVRSLPIICNYEIEYYKKYHSNLLSWFGSDAHSCSYREGMCCVGSDGFVYTCHGVPYVKEDCKSEILGNISDTKWIDNYLSNVGTHKLIIQDECNLCTATHCSICCVQSMIRSKKTTQIEKWYDRTLQKQLCKYYKVFGIYDKALHTILTRNYIKDF